MRRESLPGSERENPVRERLDTFIGLATSAFLTILAFGLVIARPFSKEGLTVSLGILALLQIVCQFRFFLHIDLKRSHRDDLHLVLFAFLVILMMVGGSMWILISQHSRMG